MFSKYLYKVKNKPFICQFFIKDDLIVGCNLYKESGAIVQSYTKIYQDVFNELNIPVEKTIIQKVKNGKNIDEIAMNKTLKDVPTTLKDIDNNLLMEKLSGEEKNNFTTLVQKISTSRDNALTQNTNAEPIKSAYLFQGHCFFIKTKKEQWSLSRTEIRENSIIVRHIGSPSNGQKTFLKNPESMIDFLWDALECNKLHYMTEEETGQFFVLYRNNESLTILPYTEELEMIPAKMKSFNIQGEVVENDSADTILTLLTDKMITLKGIRQFNNEVENQTTETIEVEVEETAEVS